MASATDDDGDRNRNHDKTTATIDVAENSEGRSATATTTMAHEQQTNKRARRVSFAELTSVRFFDRDEFNETSPDGSARSSTISDNYRAPFVHSRGNDQQVEEADTNRNFNQKEGSADDEEDEDLIEGSFFRPNETPSPGSNVGSATSNDEDNFFGPVSASFIKPDRLSGSAASDDNHDITMDSTAFSMHFRSLARSESGLDSKTPTGIHLSFEEKTPTHTTLGNSMVLTAKKPIFRSAVLAANVSGSSDSSDMSLVVENPHKYDYERLSPGLDEVLAEGKKNSPEDFVSGNTTGSRSPRIMGSKILQSAEQGDCLEELYNQKETHLHDEKLSDTFPQQYLDDVNDGPGASTVCHAEQFVSSTLGTPLCNISVDNSSVSANQDKQVIFSKKADESSTQDLAKQQDQNSELGLSDGYKQPEGEFLLPELRSSSPAKQYKSIMGSLTPLSMVTPTQQQYVKSYLGSESSIQRSIMKLEKLQASSISSYKNSKIKNSLAHLIGPSKSAISSNSLLEKMNEDFLMIERISKDIQMKKAGDPLSRNDKQLGRLSQERGATSMNIDENGIVSTKHSQDIDHTEESLNLLVAETCNTGQRVKRTPSTPSPSVLMSSGNEVGTLAPYNDNAGSMVTLETDCSPSQTVLDIIGEKKMITTLPSLISSPNRWLVKRSASSPVDQDGLSTKNHDEQVTGAANSGVLIGSTIEVSSPVIEVKGVKGSTGQNYLHDKQDGLGNSKIFRSPLLQEESQLIHPMKLDWNPSSRMSLSKSRNNLSGGESRAVAGCSASVSVCTNFVDSRLQKNLLESFEQSPSKKDTDDQKDFGGVQPPIMEDLISSKSLELMDDLSSSNRKRRNGGVILSRENRDENFLPIRSPKLQKIGVHDAQVQRGPSEVCRGAHTSVHELKKWTDIYSKLLEDAERLLPSAVDNLNLHAIDMMDDVLARLHQSKAYLALCDRSLLQKTSIHNGVGNSRIFETLRLVQRTAYELAKTQLMLVKRGILQDKMQQFNSELQRSRMLKSSYLPQQSVKYPIIAPGDAVCHQSPLSREEDVNECLEASNRKVSNFIKMLHLSCKIKGEHSYADTLVLVNEHITRRTCCSLIRLDMQMWVVHNVERRNTHHVLTLNYLGLIIQRITVTVCPVSSIAINNRLNDVDISKKFPNMDALTAFGFVLYTEISRKYVGLRSLAQETQVTSSHLSNLLDVIQEIQLAQIELQNLIRITFYSQSAERLTLQPSFFNFKIGMKLTLSLDISCLKQGIYPSKARVSDLEAVHDEKGDTSANQVLGEIRDAVQTVGDGYRRILRVCRCISHVVEKGKLRGRLARDS